MFGHHNYCNNKHYSQNKVIKKNMKKSIYLSTLFCLFLAKQNYSQNIGINGTGANAHPSALLDIDDAGTNTKGLLIPRIALQAINLAAPVTSPAISLLLYNTAIASSGTNAITPGYYYWDGTKWVRFAYNPSGTSATAWNTLGNANTIGGINFLGTTDAQDLVFKTNNLEAMRVAASGNVGIGDPNPSAQLLVNSTSGLTAAPILRMARTGATGVIQFHSGAAAGDWSGLVGSGDKSIIFSNDLNPNIDDPTGLVIAAWSGTANPTGFNKGLKIMENGRMGIGTGNPLTTLHVKTGMSPDGIHLENLLNTNWIQLATNTSNGAYNGLTQNGDRVLCWGDFSIGATNTGLTIGPWDPLQKGIRIDGISGNVGIGLTTPAFKLEVNGTTGCSGNVWTSDKRKKKNIHPINLSGLDIIKKLNPVAYEWIDVQDDGMKGQQMGFIAQELETVLPSIVVTTNNEIKSKGVKYNELLPIYAKAIQEQQIQIEEIKKENQELKKQITRILKLLK